MTKQKKKPKTGDVVGWAVVNRTGRLYDSYRTRKVARENLKDAQVYGSVKPYRLAKIVLA